ncbi:MAG: radical SAM protein [Lachnospiraceae bacterium]|nr:radical SAM protein [Lachnospiraceae bacterium]
MSTATSIKKRKSAGSSDLRELFSFHPDKKAKRERLIKEARRLYRAGRNGERLQPVYDSYDGLLGKFYLYPTFRCPLRCPYCYAEGGERESEELLPGQLIRITEEAVHAGYRAVVIVGGEPLVYSGFKAYLSGLEAMDKRGCRFVLRTSFAFPVKADLMARLCHVFDEICVSLDGNEKTNDVNRGKGSFTKTLANIDLALELGGQISVSAVLSEEDAKAEPGDDLIAVCRERGIKKLVMNNAIPMGRAKRSGCSAYYEWRADRASKMPDRIEPSFSCGLGRSLYMQPDGKVYPCYAWCEDHHLLGDLSRESLGDILARKELLGILNTGVDTNQKCCRCDVRYFCGGKCKIWVGDRTDINSGDFDCGKTREGILRMLQAYGVIPENGEDKSNIEKKDPEEPCTTDSVNI